MIRKMTKTVKEWNQKNSGVQVVVVRGAGETSEPVLVDGEDIDNHSIDWRWYIHNDCVKMCGKFVKHRQSFLQWGRCGLIIQRGCRASGDLLLNVNSLSVITVHLRVPNNLSQATYLKEEYALDLAIHKLAVPYVSIMDGITMGGGCGISVNGRCS